MKRSFGLKAMLYFVVVMYGITCCLLYVVIADYKKERQRDDHSRYVLSPKILGNLTKKEHLSAAEQSHRVKVNKPNEPKLLDTNEIKPPGPGFKSELHQAMPVTPPPFKNTNQTHFSLEGLDFQTLVRSGCSQRSLWPVIALEPGTVANLPQTSQEERDCARPQFSPNPLPSTALASFPGCGNTWSRHLIQQLSGIWTGSLYSDKDLLQGGFSGEGVSNHSVIVTKTHWPYVKPNASSVEHYPRTVLVIRSPQHCLLAEYHRRHSHDHTGLAPAHLFNDTKWDYFVRAQVKFWFWFYETWLKKNTCTLVLDYHRLQADLAAELRQLASFLGIKGNHVEDNIKCILKHSQGKFRRKGKKTLSVFNEQQRKEVKHYSELMTNLLKRKANYEPLFTW